MNTHVNDDRPDFGLRSPGAFATALVPTWAWGLYGERFCWKKPPHLGRAISAAFSASRCEIGRETLELESAAKHARATKSRSSFACASRLVHAFSADRETAPGLHVAASRIETDAH